MKLLLWACIMCVTFAKRRRYSFIHKKSPSSIEEDYFGHRYPFNPSLNMPYGLWNDNLPPFLLPPLNTQQGNAITKFPGNSEFERGLSLYSWIPTSSKLRYIFQSLNYPPDAPLNNPPAAPLPPPQHLPPRPYPFVIPPKISIISPVGPEPAAASAMPAEGEGLVPKYPEDKPISGLPSALKLETPMPPSGPKPLAPKPAPAQFGAPEPAPGQFGAPEPVPGPFGAPEPAPGPFGAPEPAPGPFGAPESAPPQSEVAVPAAAHPMAPEPALSLSMGKQSVVAESPAGLSPGNKPTSGEPAVAQSLPALSAAGLAAEDKLPVADSAAGQPPPAELMESQSVVGKLITAEPTEAKPEGSERVEATSVSQELQPFFYQVEKK